MWVTADRSDRMVPAMDDQHEAWKRMTDARLRYLEMSVSPPRIRLARSGRPKPPDPYEPGDRQPLTRWLEVRVMAIELVLRMMFDADEDRAEEIDVEPLEHRMELTLSQLEKWCAQQIEPDERRRETIAMIRLARAVMSEAHTWPLVELEDME